MSPSNFPLRKSLALSTAAIVILLLVILLLLQRPIDPLTFVVGVLSSLLASIVVLLVFVLTAEREFAHYVATSASTEAVKQVMKLVALTPESVFEGSASPNPRFEDRFGRDLKHSQFYYFFSTTADYCAGRLLDLATRGMLADKRVRVLVLNPMDTSLLEAHVRKRLQDTPTESRQLQDAFNAEKERLQKEILRTLVRLHALAATLDVDVKLHGSFAFFRSEIFDRGMLLTFQKGRALFPTSVYYSRESPVYEAYYRHHLYYQSLPGFSLKAASRNPRELLSSLQSPWSIEELSGERP